MKIKGPKSYPHGGFIYSTDCNLFIVEVGIDKEHRDKFRVYVSEIYGNQARINVLKLKEIEERVSGWGKVYDFEEVKEGTDLSDITFDITDICW